MAGTFTRRLTSAKATPSPNGLDELLTQALKNNPDIRVARAKMDEAEAELARAVPGVHVIASGGVTTLDDLRRLAEAGVPGAIIGRALYEGRLDLREAIRSLNPASPRG